MTHTVARTTTFFVSPSLVNFMKTVSKSIGFGATNILPPNAERWLHKQWSCSLVVFDPSCWLNMQWNDYLQEMLIIIIIIIIIIVIIINNIVNCLLTATYIRGTPTLFYLVYNYVLSCVIIWRCFPLSIQSAYLDRLKN